MKEAGLSAYGWVNLRRISIALRMPGGSECNGLISSAIPTCKIPGSGGLRLARVFRTKVRGKLFVALRFKVPHHRVEILSGRRIGWVEDPGTFRTAPTTKTWLVYPHQLTWHGRIICSDFPLSNIDHLRFPPWPRLLVTVQRRQHGWSPFPRHTL